MSSVFTDGEVMWLNQQYQTWVRALDQLRHHVSTGALEIELLTVKGSVMRVSCALARCKGLWVAVPDSALHGTALIRLTAN